MTSSSARSGYSTGTKTFPLVVVCGAGVLVVACDTEALRVCLSCALLPRHLRGGESGKEGFRRVPICNCLNKAMPLIHPVIATTSAALFLPMHTDYEEVTRLTPIEGTS